MTVALLLGPTGGGVTRFSTKEIGKPLNT